MDNKDGSMKIDHSDIARCRVSLYYRRFTEAQSKIIFTDILDVLGKGPPRVGGDDFGFWVDRILDDYFAERAAPTPTGKPWQVVEVDGRRRINQELEIERLDELEGVKKLDSTKADTTKADTTAIFFPTVLACKIDKAKSLEWRVGLLSEGDEFEASQLVTAFSESRTWKSHGVKAPPGAISAAKALVGRKRGIDVRVLAVSQTWTSLTKNE